MSADRYNPDNWENAAAGVWSEPRYGSSMGGMFQYAVWRHAWTALWVDLADQLMNEECERLRSNGAALDHWRVLEVLPTGDEREIKRAYVALVRRHPPEIDAEGFQRIRAAYEAAINETKVHVSANGNRIDVRWPVLP